MRRALALALLAAAAVAVPAPALETARCVGAAARDPEHPGCHVSPLAVFPAPEDALIAPAEPCTIVRRRFPEVCAFGVPKSQARATFALVGDSHAAHWRAALAVVARAERWRGLDLDRSRCPFAALRKATTPHDRAVCARWNARVRGWFAHHPSVSIVFVSQRRQVHVVPRPGLGQFDTRVAGFADAWNGLPASVHHVIALADVPYNRPYTFACVEHALARRRSPDQACAVPRALALTPDPALAAAAQIGPPRVQSIDLTPFMCTARDCLPVVGGVLVHKDRGHLTTAFSGTLGPFLLRDLRRLRRSW
ncbi:MAG: SGNH hydrolase domain-containing protein [Gemmatimonadaceae bacterium]